ncbi:DUF6270 domain-containing protein [Phenylobacterium sp.]|uniref:DUF6270 domain-containing protein n=1 Tax=Phenylobacterium sp. TaxID=1871053 RepID=UPI003567B0D1
MSRVAIVGSCITRDVWRLSGRRVTGPAPDLLYIQRTSLPSLFAAPLPGFRPAAAPPGGLKPLPHNALVADLQKTTLASLVAFRPTHVIFDFIDERYDLLSARGTLVTDTWELECSGYRSQPALRAARPIRRLSAACEQLWLESVRELSAFVQATPLAQARLILHSARWATHRRLADGREAPIAQIEILPGHPADVAAHNALLGRYEAAFMALVPNVHRVEAPDFRLADDAHDWGLSPFHYVSGYYAEIWRQLSELGVRGRALA